MHYLINNFFGSELDCTKFEKIKRSIVVRCSSSAFRDFVGPTKGLFRAEGSTQLHESSAINTTQHDYSFARSFQHHA